MTLPVYANSEPILDSAHWWLMKLINELLMRHPMMERREHYVHGRHDMPRGDRQYMRAVRDFQQMAGTNYIGLVTGAPVERMKVRGFRFGEAGTADSDAQTIWQSNDMDLQSSQIHMRAATFGLAYALVSPPDVGSEWPIITAEDPRTTIVCRDPVRPTRTLAGLRMWVDEVVGRVLAVLYLTEGVYAYVGPTVYEIQAMSIDSIRQRLTLALSGGPSAFELVEFTSNPLPSGDVPLVEYVWRPESGIIPEGEAGADIRNIQDRINQTVFNRLVIGHFQAYKQRYATGITIPKSKKGQRKPPFDPGASTLWTSANADAKFGEFTSADIRQILEAVRDDISDIAAITKTPAHYLMGKMANISGETLTQAESGLVSKTQLRMDSMGWSHERVMKLSFAYLHDKRAQDITAATLWADPQKQITAELALAGLQWAQIGWPLELIMERQGASPDEIAFAVAKKKEADQLALDQQQQLAKVAANPPAKQLSTAKGTSGKPATKPKSTT